MKSLIIILGAVLASAAYGCRSQSLQGVAKSHIDANVPSSDHFDEYMKRDLSGYLCIGKPACRVEFQMLRQGATQSGIAYPKFYVWVKRSGNDVVGEEGAARVAAIDRDSFHVTHYLTASQITSDPDEVKSIFPAVLLDDIARRARAAIK